MTKEVGVVSTGIHKKEALSSVLNGGEIILKMLKMDGDIPEVEHQNPKKVLKPKLADYIHILRPSLTFLAEAGEIPPHAVLTMDLLGLDMSNAETLNAPFGHSSGILKKPDDGTPARAIAEHYSKKLKYRPIGGYVYDAFASGVAVAPVNRHGEVLLNYTTALWDNAVWMGCSLPLAHILADERTVNKLVEAGILGPNTTSMRSINGIRQQHLIKDLGRLNRAFPGEDLSMKVVYRNINLRIDGRDDLSRLTHATNIVDSNMANATPFLGRMIIDTVNKYNN